jgi:hypothetical protein
MSRPLPDNNPFRMSVPTRRDGLTGEAAIWYDRADWLRGKTLQVPAEDRSAFQQSLDELWSAVEAFENGTGAEPDRKRLDRVFRSFFDRWPDALGKEPPAGIG